MKNLKLLLIGLVLLTLLTSFIDIHFTLLGVKKLGLEAEGNHIVKKLLEENPLYWIALKLFYGSLSMIACIGILKYRFKHKLHLYAPILMMGYTFIMTLFENVKWGFILFK